MGEADAVCVEVSLCARLCLECERFILLSVVLVVADLLFFVFSSFLFFFLPCYG